MPAHTHDAEYFYLAYLEPKIRTADQKNYHGILIAKRSQAGGHESPSWRFACLLDAEESDETGFIAMHRQLFYGQPIGVAQTASYNARLLVCYPSEWSAITPRY